MCKRAKQRQDRHQPGPGAALRPWRRQVQSGGRREPSSDTPVVMAPGMLSCLPGQVLKPACLKLQAASALTSPALVGGILFQPYSAANWRNHLRLSQLLVCFRRHSTAHDPGSSVSPTGGGVPFWAGRCRESGSGGVSRAQNSGRGTGGRNHAKRRRGRTAFRIRVPSSTPMLRTIHRYFINGRG